MEQVKDREGREVNKYRIEHGSVFEYDIDHDAYLFIGKLMGRSLWEFIRDQLPEWEK